MGITDNTFNVNINFFAGTTSIIVFGFITIALIAIYVKTNKPGTTK